MFFLKNKQTLFKCQKPLQNSNRFEYKGNTASVFCAHIILLILMAAVILTGVTLRDSLIAAKIDDLAQSLFAYTARHGFAIEDIVIEGRDKTSLSDLNEELKLNRRDSILNVNLQHIKTRLEDLPWVDKVELKRSYFPNILQISLKEKDIVALFQTGEHFYPIDKKGQVIDVEYHGQKPFLILVGAGAPEKFLELVEVTKTEPELHARIKAAILNSGRRWDLIFDDLEHGLKVKMPEKDFEGAWKKLIKIDHKYSIFKRKLTFIDLRYEDKVSGRLAD